MDHWPLQVNLTVFLGKWALSSLTSIFAGRIDAQEIMQSLRDLGVKISEQQAEKILKRCVFSWLLHLICTYEKEV